MSSPMQGDFDIAVRTVGLKNSVANSTLGLLARESLDFDARDVYLFLRPNRDSIAASQARLTDDVESVKTIGKETGVKFPCWLRMTRRGDVFETWLSADGEKWRSLGSVTSALSPHLYVGLMVSSHRTSLLTEGVFDKVSVRGTIPTSDRVLSSFTRTRRSTGSTTRTGPACCTTRGSWPRPRRSAAVPGCSSIPKATARTPGPITTRSATTRSRSRSSRRRSSGEEWIRAIEAELPSPRLLFAFLMPTTRLMDDLDWPIEKITADMPRMRYGLLPAFINGVLRGAGPKTKLIEGNEHAYYYRSPSEYQTFARYMRETLPRAYLREELWPKSSRQVQVGLSLYPSYYFGASYKSIAQHMTPDERSRWYEHNLYWAFKTSDEYVWDWLEGPQTIWDSGPDWSSGDKLPPGYLEAIQQAQRKVADNAPLGFESASLFAAVKSRAAETRPTAQVATLIGRPPAIDGKLDDDAWKSTGFGFQFKPLLAWKQQGHQETQASVTYDDDSLYVAFRCAEERPATMRAKTTSPDDYFLANDDHVQVLIASPQEPEKLIYRLMLNSLGLTNDAFIRGNPDPKTRTRDPLIVDVKGYNPDWQHAVQVLPDAWTSEFRIPWKSLTIAAPPRPGTSLRLNLGRFRSQGLNWERTYWAPVLEMKGDTFERLDPELFGTVQLK